MIIDTSAIIAVLKDEEMSAQVISTMKKANEIGISAGTWLELFIVVENKQSPVTVGRTERLLAEFDVTIAPVCREQSAIGRKAFRDFGRGRHRAKLNFGDCFSYALAKHRRQSLLYVGNDFSLTDIDSALIPDAEPSH